MSGIKLSPKYGVNPTIPVCFWCGEEKNEVALMRHVGDGRKHEDFEMPRYAVIDYEPCEHCREMMAKGFTVLEATSSPNKVTNVAIQDGVYPTGRYVVIKNEAARRIFAELPEGSDKIFMESAQFKRMFSLETEAV